MKKSTPGYPTSGPIDLMKYYDDKKQKASFTQLISDSIASEKDVMRLIWLSKIKTDSCDVKLNRSQLEKRIRKNGSWTLLIDESLTACE